MSCGLGGSPHRFAWTFAALVLVGAPSASAQVAFDQQNNAAAWTCLNTGSFTMSQTFTPTFSRLNFAEIHLDANKGPLVDGDFSLRVLRNGNLIRESDRLAVDATSGMDDAYYRFNFSSEAFLSPGLQYELQLVNHSNSSFFAWCQAQNNVYAGGAPTVSPAGGGVGDFLFRTGMQSLYGPPQASPNGRGFILFESALPPGTAPPTGGVSVSNAFYTGLNFEVKAPTRLSRVGGYFSGGGGPVFAAVVQAGGFGTKPNPPNLTGSDVLATTLVNIPVGGGDAWGDIDLQLQPGWYGVIFGTGRFGAPTGSYSLREMSAPNGPYWSPYTLIQSSGSQVFQAIDVRIFGQASSPPGTMQQRPAFDTLAERFGGHWILTDGERDIAPYRFDARGEDARGLMEFDLSQIPEGATITGVKISLYPDQLTSGGGAMSRLHFYGYAGDGSAAPTDAVVPLNAVGFSDVITAFNRFDVNLSATYVQSLVDQGASHLGLMIRGDASGARFNIRAWEYGTTESAPLLTIEYTAPPQDGDFDGSGIVDRADLEHWISNFGAGGLSGNDFLVWQQNLGAGQSHAAGQHVPEPCAASLALVAGMIVRRRGTAPAT